MDGKINTPAADAPVLGLNAGLLSKPLAVGDSLHVTEWNGPVVLPAVPRVERGVTRSKGARYASFLAHPIADPFFNWIIVTAFDRERRFTHVWTPTTAEAVRDAVLYNGLSFLEAFLFCLRD
jgi:hypothetical protein